MKYTSAKETYVRYLTVSGKSDTTIASYTATLTRFGAFLSEQGIEALEDVKPLIITAYMDMRSEQICPTSLNLELTHIRGMYSYFYDLDVLACSPVKKAHTVNKSALRRQQNREYDGIISKSEIISIILNSHPANTHKTQINRNRALLMVFLSTGLRNESVRELRIGDLDFDNKRIKVNAAKGNKVGYAPLTDVAAHFIRLYLADHTELTADDYLFGFTRDQAVVFESYQNGEHLYRVELPGEWLPFSRQHMSNIVEAAIRSYLPERKGIRSHALRHSFASLCSNAGMSDGEVSRLLFHSDGTGASVTRRYISDDLSGLFQKVNAIFNSLTASFNFSA